MAFLAIPIAALVYSLASPRTAAGRATAEADQGERRALSVWAIVGIVVVSALGYLSTAGILYWQFAHGSDSPTLVIKAMALQIMLPEVWIALAALPVAIASAALAHAAQTGRWGWLAGWIALTALALLSVSPEVQLRMSNGMTDAYFMDNPWIGSIFPNPTSVEAITPGIPPTQYIISIVAPAVIMLVALLYARIVMRPESGPQAAGLAVA